VAWLLLTFTLPTKRASQRVEVWRKLQRYGTVPLGNSGYLLPSNSVNEERFQWLAAAIRKYGGDASIVRVQGIDNISTPQLIGRFAEARTQEYQELIRQLDNFSALPLEKRSVGRLSRLRSRFQEIVEVDFFESPMQKRAGELLAKADAARVATRKIQMPKIEPRDYQKQGLGYPAETRCGPVRIRLAGSALYRFQGAICLCSGRKSSARSCAV